MLTFIGTLLLLIVKALIEDQKEQLLNSLDGLMKMSKKNVTFYQKQATWE